MKLMKLLLIGLLSVGTFISCGDTTWVPHKTQLKIVGVDGGTPVLYNNVTVQLKAVTTEGIDVTSAVFTSTGVEGVAVSDTDKTVKITNPATAKGTIIATAKVDGDYVTATYRIIASTLALESVVISPNPATIYIIDNVGEQQLAATATFGKGDTAVEVNVTNDSAWTIAAAPTMTLSAATKGLVEDTTVSNGVIVTAIFIGTDATVEVNSVLDTVDFITMTVQNDSTLFLPIGAKKQIIATVTYAASGVEDNITARAVWNSTDESVATVALGVVTGIKVSGDTNVTAVFGGKTGTIVITGSHRELEIASINDIPTITSISKTIHPALSGTISGSSDDVMVPALVLFSWTISLANGDPVDASIATVSELKGIISPNSDGVFILTATQRDRGNMPIIIVATTTVTIDIP